MANTIKLKRGSGSDPSASDLSVGELAVRTDTGKLFTKKDDNSVAEISGSSGSIALNDLTDAKTDNSDLAIGIGVGALAADDSGNSTLAIGKDALNDQTSGNFNCAVGVEALSKITTTGQNMAFGVFAGRYTTGSSNVAVGYSALEGSSGSTNGDNNVAIGEKALEDATGANNNVMIGYRASRDGTGTENSVAIGSESLYLGTTLYLTTTVGRQSFYSLTTGHRSCAFGYQSGYNATIAADSSFYGYKAGYFVTTGIQNTCIGSEAGAATGDNKLATGSNNIIIGYKAYPSATDVSNEITFGNSSITKLRVPALSFEITASAVTNGGAFYENAKTVAADYTLNGSNAMAAGPIAINNGITVTVSSGDTLTII